MNLPLDPNFNESDAPNYNLWCWPLARRRGLDKALLELLNAHACDRGYVHLSRYDLSSLLSVSALRLSEALRRVEWLHDFHYLTPSEAESVGLPADQSGHYDDQVGISFQLTYKAPLTVLGRVWLESQGKYPLESF